MVTGAVFVICFSALLVVINVDAYVRRDVSSEKSPTQLIDAIRENMDQFRQCVDQSLAKTVGEVNEKQLQPLFLIISDHLNRVSKAFDDLTAPRSSQGPPPG